MRNGTKSSDPPSCAEGGVRRAAGPDTPDAEGALRSFGRRLAGGMEPLRDRGADGRMVREPRRGPTRPRPPPKRRAGREVRVPACRLGWGSRRRTRRGLPRGKALRVAFPSHQTGRSPIAPRSPSARLSRRSCGGRPANDRDAGTFQPRRRERRSAIASPFLLHRRSADCSAVRFCRRIVFSIAGGPLPARRALLTE